ncbi:hypothetical protein BVE84_03680 [Streptococcus azizii]|uniref:Glycosyl transferase family 1 n=2 Tax=Streptococcus TaxID=1301 RepID=A0AB36JT22_9STRE|nr:hypothetical protein BVE86_03250 [Streptococcus azizii]ONK29001.1 hypothetical protein BVE85_03980 [Streptococcus azizii]ONK30173.1 hypothetical protein BVE84_03680 [Streptococcus azizii]
MKIAILNSYLFPIPAVRGGAVETLIESIVKAANEDAAVEVTIFSLADDLAIAASQDYPNVRFQWLKRPPLLDLIDRGITSFLRLIKGDKDLWQKNYLWQIMSARKTRQLLLEQDYDIICIQNAPYLCSLFEERELGEKYRGKVYFHTHNSQARKVNPSIALAGVISISHYLEENIRACFGETVPIQVVHNGVATEQFDVALSAEEKEELASRYQIPANAPIILFVGRMMPKKGVWELLQAFQKLENTAAHLLLVGASSFGMATVTPFEKEVAAVVASNSRIHTTGFVANEELGKYYALADVVVLPSIWEEPLGLTMIEAQLSGTPLITTNQGGIPESTNPAYSILIEVSQDLSADLARAIDEVLDHPTVWKEKALQAQAEAESRFNEKRFYHNIMKTLGIATVRGTVATGHPKTRK